MRQRWLSFYAAGAYLFLHLPLAVLAVFSFNSSRFTVWEGFTLAWYEVAWRDEHLLEATMNSFVVAASATGIATAVGTLCAYALWKRGCLWISATLYLSLVTPEIVLGVALLAFYQWLFRHLNFQLGMHTVILAHVMFSIAYVVTVVSARLRGFDRAQEEAAMDLGATEWQAFFRVTLPQLLPGVFSAALLAFIISFDDFVITSFVAGVDSETLPMVIYSMARKGFSPAVNAISTVIVFVLGVLILLVERLRER
ncbi:MAG: ABC transporter permease [Bryobacteraceae bacterium]|nr:ABC transporter permease [Bryobacteraceae bacterium]MDW8377326.1 ABC transporter permease [Bryobacterales bacterium]